MTIIKRIYSDNKKILSIITVVKNDYIGLFETARSVNKIINRDKAEYIVWINSDSDYLKLHIDACYDFADLIIIGSDVWIFDAMNKALKFASGNYVLFLNARDKIIEPFDAAIIQESCLIRVIYKNYFGKFKTIKPRKKLKFGIPYCHQGMILHHDTVEFDASLIYGADYEIFFRKNVKWPLPMLKEGCILYDTTGISTRRRWLSDKWTAKIIYKRFGILYACIYLSFCVLKLTIKRLYDTKLILYHLCKKILKFYEKIHNKCL